MAPHNPLTKKPITAPTHLIILFFKIMDKDKILSRQQMTNETLSVRTENCKLVIFEY